MTMLGHNNGPTMEKGAGWRRYAWKRARADLMPTLPLEVARRRVKRARELGIDYKSYAGIRAATGRDIVALIFSSNALRLAKETALIEAARAEKLQQIKYVDSLGLIQPPFAPRDVQVKNPILVATDRAPGLMDNWRDTRDRILALKGTIPADGIVVIGDTTLERDWSEAGRLAGFLPSARYFAATS